MNINAVVVQVGLNTNYSAFIGALQDLQSVITQVSAAFKTAAANAQLINPSNASMNIGFDGTATVGSNTATDTASGNNYDGVDDPMHLLSHGQNITLDLASLLTLETLTTTTTTSNSVTKTSYSSTDIKQSPAWNKLVIKKFALNSSLTANPLTDIYIGLGSTEVSEFIKKNSISYSNASSNGFGPYVTNPITLAYGRAVPDSGSYFVNQDNIQKMINTLGAQAKAITGTDFSKANSSWYKGGTQCDGLSSALNTVLSTVQAQGSSVISQIGLVNQNNSTLTNSILSAFQSIANALMKI